MHSHGSKIKKIPIQGTVDDGEAAAEKGYFRIIGNV